MMKLRTLSLLCVLLVAAGSCAPYSGNSRDISFRSEDSVELRGSLVYPEGQSEKVPGVVVLHGAEPATRSFAYRMQANIFLERGMAVLLYDKRGAGESEGNHDTATYAMFIEDALAAVRFLRDQDGVDTTRIGIVGASESGWLTPEIAERAGGIAFIINKVGSAVSWRETVQWEVYNDIRNDGVDEGSAKEQAVVRRQMWDYYISPDSAEGESLRARLDEWSKREDSHLPKELSSVSASYIQDIRYDPTPYLERITVPTLYIYGSEDINIPATKCVERLSVLQEAGLPVSYHVFEGEGHELGGIGIGGYAFTEGYEKLVGAFAVEKTLIE